MDKDEALGEIALQSEADARTVVRRVRDEAKALISHLDVIDEQLEDLEYMNGLPESLEGLRGLLDDIHELEQRLLKVQIKVSGEGGERQ